MKYECILKINVESEFELDNNNKEEFDNALISSIEYQNDDSFQITASVISSQLL